EVRRPGVSDEQPHQHTNGEREADVIKQPDGQEAEDERLRRPPEPCVLMQHVQHNNEQHEEQSFHEFSSALCCFSEGEKLWKPLLKLRRTITQCLRKLQPSQSAAGLTRFQIRSNFGTACFIPEREIFRMQNHKLLRILPAVCFLFCYSASLAAYTTGMITGPFEDQRDEWLELDLTILSCNHQIARACASGRTNGSARCSGNW